MSKRKNNQSLGQQSRLRQTINGLLLASALVVVPSVMAEGSGDNTTPRHYHIGSGSLSHALSQFAGSAGILLSADARLTDGKSSPGLQGEYTVAEGLQKLLAGSGLVHVFTAGNAVTLKVAEKQSQANPLTLPTVKVTGAVELDVNDPYNQSYTVTNSSTATKTDTPIMDTPVSIQVVPRAVLKDQQAFRIQDAVKNVSGVQQRDNDGYDNFIVRGFDLGRLTFRNGIRIPLVNLDFANIQQVEVLKGPASILFGRIEPGGMINAVTKRPQEEAYYSLEQRFGSYDFYRTEASATGALTDDKSLLYRFDLSYMDKNSYRDFVLNDRIFIAPSLTWKPSDSTEFNLSLD